MRPSDFKLNTDFLNIATLAKSEHIFGFAERIVFARYTLTESQDITVPDGTKGIPIYLISRDGNSYSASPYGSFSAGTNLTAYYSVSRVGSNVLRFTLSIRNSSNSTKMVSAMNFWVREALLSAPNAI